MCDNKLCKNENIGFVASKLLLSICTKNQVAAQLLLKAHNLRAHDVMTLSLYGLVYGFVIWSLSLFLSRCYYFQCNNRSAFEN